ncbi:MAG: hypothetical protein KH897_02410 [Bacteroides sp.]|uniref:LamG-like jellyroll fold domain-containing protein n=1 Tax=Bacteroides sp. TaxID=29523 RepID=UPI0025BD692E|nr:LamG-like jellyroll fold domain-containing protein [Bacteroides sp.]MBS6237236.1 hypothetical protein [Bacteroides sp.]
MDPIPGHQVLPKLEQVANLTFDDEKLNPEEIQTFAYPDGDIPSLFTDETLGQVLQLEGGYARIFNPLNKVTVQNGVSLTFWMKQAAPESVEEGETPEEQDLTGAIFSFENGNATQRMFFTANGWLNYTGVDGSYEDNNPASVKTGLITAGEWHYVAVAITNNGYFVYVDGLKKIEKTITDFDCSKIVQFMASVPYIYIGYGSDSKTKEMLIDDFKIYRNTITSKEIALPKKEGNTEDDIYEFPPKGTVGYYKLDNTFDNSLNPDQSGELVTVQTQSTPSAFEIDATRGTVWHQQEGWTDNANGWAYTRFDNPLKGEELSNGLSINLWINPPVLNWWDQIFVMNDGTAKFWFNAIGYLGFHTGGDPFEYFDCHNNNDTNAMKAGEWTFVSINILPDGFEVYYNGEFKFDRENNASYAGTLTDFTKISTVFANASDFFLGYESWWKAAPALIDDILLINRPLSEKEVKNLYTDTKKTNGGIVENPAYAPSLHGYYTLDNTFDNALNPDQSGELVTVQTQSTPSAFETDPVRGTVWHQQEGWTDNANGWAYTRFDNPLRGADLSNGLSITMWINPPVLNWWDQIFVMNDGTAKFWFNAIGYLGFHTGGDPFEYFDCHNNNDTNAMEANKWTLVTINILPDGFEVYYNGELKFDRENNAGYVGTLTDFTKISTVFTNASDFFLGYESWWKAAPALVDDIYLCAAPLTAMQAKAIYNATKK